MSIIFTDKLFYERNACFLIEPIFNEEDAKHFAIYLGKLKIKYQMLNNCESYFWDYNAMRHSISINENVNVVDEDIFNQFYLIVRWLFNRGYNLQGTCYLRMGNLIEKIEIKSNHKFVLHNILYDYFPYHDLTENLVNVQQVNEYILDTSKEKINFYHTVNNKPGNDCDKESLVQTCHNLDNTIKTIVHEQHNYSQLTRKFIGLSLIMCALTVGSVLYHANKRQ